MSHCDVCWAILPSSSHEEAHYASKGHLINLQFKLNREDESREGNFCELCCKEIPDCEQFQAHMSSKSHLKKKLDKEFIVKIKPTLHKSFTFASGPQQPTQTLRLTKSASFILGEPLINKKPFCSICYVEYTSKQHEESHLSGQSHKKRQEVRRSLDISPRKVENCCEVCLVVILNDSQFEAHLNSDKHKKAVEQRNRVVDCSLLSTTTTTTIESSIEEEEADDIDDEELKQVLTLLEQQHIDEQCIDYERNVFKQDALKSTEFVMDAKWNQILVNFNQVKATINEQSSQDWCVVPSSCAIKNENE